MRRNNSFQYSVGLRWQSLIVTPEKQKWMKPPEVELNEHHRWWQGLRKVPSSWISSRGESERFLYYDGPTVIKSPIIVSRDSDRIVIHSRKLDDFASAVDSKLYLTQTPQFATQKNFAKHRHSIYIHVGGTESAANNSISGKIVKLQQEQTSISLEQDLPLTGSALESKLLELLVDYGLTNAEAMGLIETWHPQFFETPGERVITLLTPPDYDAMCRLQVHPRPTEIVRAGIILTELSPLE